MEKISIIIPFIKGGDLLKEAIESALSQSYSNVEIVLVNNNATEESANIAKHYVSRYKNIIKIVYEKEQGICSATNSGLINSGGKYIALLDSDDIMKPERIKIQYEFLKENPTASLVSCFHDSLSHDGKVVLEVNKPELSYGNQGIYEWKSLIHNLFIPLKLTYHKSFDLFSATFFFFRKEDSIKIGLFDKRMNPRDKQDWEFSLRMFEIGKFLHVPISLQYFREESVETRKYKNKDVTQLYTMIQEQKFFSILWERYGKNIPENFNTFKRLQSFTLKRFGGPFMHYSHGKSLGKKLISRAIFANPYDIQTWKLLVKAYSPSIFHPRLFEFEKERTESLEVNLNIIEKFLSIPFNFPNLSNPNPFESKNT